MNPKTEHESLLDDVLAGGEEPLRDALLAETLRLARRRRHVRQLRRLAPVAAVLLAAALLWWRSQPPGPPSIPARGYELVSSRPSSAVAVVITHPAAASPWLVAVPRIARIETAKAARAYREIDDNELLSLAGSETAALVRFGPHHAELVFVDPAAQAERAQ